MNKLLEIKKIKIKYKIILNQKVDKKVFQKKKILIILIKLIN